MKPRRTPHSNQVFRLEGGTEDNDLWVERTTSEQGPVIRSVWELSDDERQRVAGGENVYLVVWGTGTPPVGLARDRGGWWQCSDCPVHGPEPAPIPAQPGSVEVVDAA